MPKQKKIQRAVSVHELLNTNYKLLNFEDEWRASFGCPELTGSWIIWGSSGNGKTYFAMQLAKYLTKFGKVAYDSLEEGRSESLKKAAQETGMMEVARKIIFLDKEPIKELIIRLSQPKSPNIIFIDSVQHSRITYPDYIDITERFRKKLFIFISHAQGKMPKGRVADDIRYDANVKLRVEGYRIVKPLSRYGGGEKFDIWPEEAIKYHSY